MRVFQTGKKKKKKKKRKTTNVNVMCLCNEDTITYERIKKRKKKGRCGLVKKSREGNRIS